MSSPEFERNLEKYADVLIRVGLNLQPGQRLAILARIEAISLVRSLTKKAYQAGASYVDVIFNDEELRLTRFQYAPRDSFEESATWIAHAITAYAERGDAALWIGGGDPDLLKGQDPNLLATVQKVEAKESERYLELVGENAFNWLVAAAPHPAWAAKVLPDIPADQREAKMWDLIFDLSRINDADPIAMWQAHIQDLNSRRNYLNNKRYAMLKYTAPGTDLTIGLPEGHNWEGAGSTSQKGIFFVPNIPTEEVFTLPHKDKVNGTVTTTKPRTIMGTLIDKFCLTFEGGKVVNVSAEKGAEVLRNLL